LAPNKLWIYKLSGFLNRLSTQLNCNFSFNYAIDQFNIDNTIERLLQLKELLYKIQIQKNEAVTTKKINQFINRLKMTLNPIKKNVKLHTGLQTKTNNY
jgi:hypothetical protein